MCEYLYHTTPLHYLPHVIADGALFAQSVLVPRGIVPRATAARRDRMLGLADYVHLSLHSETPLLADKLARGYPHALLVFGGPEILARPDTALVPYNAKSWYTKSAYAPVTEPAERARLLARHAQGRYPSLEVLVKYGLDLAPLRRIAFLTDNERDLVAALLDGVRQTPSAPLVTEPSLFPRVASYAPVTITALRDYFGRCTAAGALLPPPVLPFD